MAETDEWYVEIVEPSTDFAPERIEKRMGPKPHREAEKIAREAEINLNHERFYVRVVS